jgi:hypothetical protein
MNYSMISESAILPQSITNWFAQWTNRPGHTSDGVNRIYPHAPPSDLLGNLEEVLTYDELLAETDAQLALSQTVSQAASRMISVEPKVLVGPKYLFKMLYNTPQHKIWCVMDIAESDMQYKAAFFDTFGYAQTNETPEQASAMVKQHFTNLQAAP